MRMPALLHIRIHSNRNERRFIATLYAARRFVEQNLELCFRLNIEKQNSARVCVTLTLASTRDSILQCLANLCARFAHSGKNNLLASNSDSSQHLQLAAGDDVEPIPRLRHMLQNCEVAIRFHRKAKCVRQRAKSTMQLRLRIIDRSAAVQIHWRANLVCDIDQSHAFACDGFGNARAAPRRALFLPGKVRRKRRRIDKRQLLRRRFVLATHRTFSTTSVRSSESGALCENQSTSLNTRSINSAAFNLW